MDYEADLKSRDRPLLFLQYMFSDSTIQKAIILRAKRLGVLLSNGSEIWNDLQDHGHTGEMLLY